MSIADWGTYSSTTSTSSNLRYGRKWQPFVEPHERVFPALELSEEEIKQDLLRQISAEKVLQQEEVVEEAKEPLYFDPENLLI